ncbi:hypothetical protein B9Z19DRAFT_1137687 [Tuber borchii]|uniref:Uncharacterized protein n=1 Tax=Tuber borchii TaxID=42251 RepID=A0A2T6ZAE2_TUBBO|nr:hypothetical protein B9Z19DRAFT_1137687 [Tuber borchii]
MTGSNPSSLASLNTFSSKDTHSQLDTSGNLNKNFYYPNPIFETLYPGIFIGPSPPSDTVPTSRQPFPVMAFPKVGTLAHFMLSEYLVLAMNTELESNLTEREIIEALQSRETRVSAGNRNVAGVQGGHLITVEETSESSGWENELILHPSQTEEDLSCSSDSSGGSENEERPWVLANEGTEGSADELAVALKSLQEERVKKRKARKGVWRYLG